MFCEGEIADLEVVKGSFVEAKDAPSLFHIAVNMNSSNRSDLQQLFIIGLEIE